MHREETPSQENPASSVASKETPIAKEVAKEVIEEIDVEFEKYLAMRSAVRKKSGKWRRSFLTENAN